MVHRRGIGAAGAIRTRWPSQIEKQDFLATASRFGCGFCGESREAGGCVDEEFAQVMHQAMEGPYPVDFLPPTMPEAVHAFVVPDPS